MTDAELKRLVKRAKGYGRKVGRDLHIGADEGESIAVCALAEVLRKWRPDGGASLVTFMLFRMRQRLFDESRAVYGNGRHHGVVRRFIRDWDDDRGFQPNLDARVEVRQILGRLSPRDAELLSTLGTGAAMDELEGYKSKSWASRNRARLIEEVRGAA